MSARIADKIATAAIDVLLEEMNTDEFMQTALELDKQPFPPFGMRSDADNARLSGAQLFRAAINDTMKKLKDSLR